MEGIVNVVAYTKIDFNFNKNNLLVKKIVCILIWILIFIVTPIVLSYNFINSTFYVSVNSNSMAPTIEEGNKIIVSRLSNEYDIKRNDIIIFYSRELKKMLIKRVVGLPGDVIYMDKNFNLKINNQYIVKNGNLKFNNEYNYDVIEQNEKIIVPNESYFVIGDNINNSFDSRFWRDKFISKDLIIGKAIVLISPLKKISVF